MKTVSDIKAKIEEIKASNFKIIEMEYDGQTHKICNLLRTALLCFNAIGGIENITKEERKNLREELDETMKSKLRELNPSFSEETLNNMTSTYKRGYIIYPMDIFVVEDAVFHKEGVFDDFGDIYKVRTFMFEGMKPYYSISDSYFILDDYDFLSPTKKVRLTIEEDKDTSKFISDSINAIYEEKITKPLYALNTDNVFYGYGGIVSDGVHVYLNMKFNDIGRSIKAKKECDIKLCIQNGVNIMVYHIHQSFKEDKPIWNVVKTSSEVWSLTKEALKLENKTENAPYKLMKRNNPNID